MTHRGSARLFNQRGGGEVGTVAGPGDWKGNVYRGDALDFKMGERRAEGRAEGARLIRGVTDFKCDVVPYGFVDFGFLFHGFFFLLVKQGCADATLTSPSGNERGRPSQTAETSEGDHPACTTADWLRGRKVGDTAFCAREGLFLTAGAARPLLFFA